MSIDNHPRIRQARKLERKKANRASYDRILIVCEGQKTEPEYFKEIRRSHKLSTTSIGIFPCQFGTNPMQVVEYAEKLFKNGNSRSSPPIPSRAFEQVYAVFDRDDHPQYHNALTKAQSLNGSMHNDLKKPVVFNAVASIPCFELWLLLHFRDVLSPIHRDDVYSQLRRFLPNYQKGQGQHFNQTKAHLREAVTRAEQLAGQNNAYTDGPYTDAYWLVKILTELQSF